MGKLLKSADWRAKGPVGASPKRSASPTWTDVGLKTIRNWSLLNLQAQEQLGESSTKSAITT